MDAIWKRTYDALTQLRREIANGAGAAGGRYISEDKRLGALILKHYD